MTPSQLLAATAADMRKVAVSATLGTAYAWTADNDIVLRLDGSMWADTKGSAVADHIAAWDPDMARAVADWLDVKADKYSASDTSAKLERDLASGSRPPMLRVCDAWWKSRGMEPKELDHG